MKNKTLPLMNADRRGSEKFSPSVAKFGKSAICSFLIRDPFWSMVRLFVQSLRGYAHGLWHFPKDERHGISAINS
jgi:hypothetical protein